MDGAPGIRPRASYVAEVLLTVAGWFSASQVSVAGVLVNWLPFLSYVGAGLVPHSSQRYCDEWGP